MSSPSDFDLLDPQLIEEPHPFYASLRAEAPVYEVPGSGTYLVATWDLVAEVVERVHDFSNNLTAVLYRGPHGRPALFDLRGTGTAIDVLATADPPTHGGQRRLVQPMLTAGRVAALEPHVRSLVQRLLEPRLRTGRVEWMGAVANPLPMRVVTRVLGLPEGDADRLLRWAFEGTELLSGVADEKRICYLGQQSAALAAYLAQALAGAPAQAPEGTLLEALSRAVDAAELSDAHAVAMLVILVGAGAESTTGLTGNAVRLLAEQPDLQERLRREPARISHFVEEALRLEPPFRGHYRVARRDAKLGGVELSAGAHLQLLWASANRDAREFERPDEVDLERRTPRHHMAFGRGIHSCVGAPLARMEARVTLETLLCRTRSFRLVAGRPPRHVPSIFVRRLAHLELLVEPA